MLLIHESVEQGRAATLDRRVSLFKSLIKCRRITNVKCEGAAVVSNAVTLETITLLLVGNADLVSMLPLEPHCLLVCRYVKACHSTIAKDGFDMSEVFINFEVGVSLL